MLSQKFNSIESRFDLVVRGLLGFFEKGMKYDGGVFMEAKKDSHFLLTTNSQFVKVC